MINGREDQRRGAVELRAVARHSTTDYGEFSIHVAENVVSKVEHVVLTMGSIEAAEDVPCRLQSECLTGMVLYSANCDCREQLALALGMIHREGRGIVVYLRQEGRGHGLTHKVRALANKNAGYDTFAAVEVMGDRADVRTYDDAAAILQLMHVRSINLLTNNPEKIEGLVAKNVRVTAVTKVDAVPTADTIVHLRAKKKRGHTVDLRTETHIPEGLTNRQDGR